MRARGGVSEMRHLNFVINSPSDGFIFKKISSQWHLSGLLTQEVPAEKIQRKEILTSDSLLSDAKRRARRQGILEVNREMMMNSSAQVHRDFLFSLWTFLLPLEDLKQSAPFRFEKENRNWASIHYGRRRSSPEIIDVSLFFSTVAVP